MPERALERCVAAVVDGSDDALSLLDELVERTRALTAEERLAAAVDAILARVQLAIGALATTCETHAELDEVEAVAARAAALVDAWLGVPAARCAA